MRQIFDQELDDLGHDLAAMARLVDNAISRASTALLTADLALAEQVISQDDAIDELERSLDERCITLLARQQPVATDLRIVVSSLRMSATLERMGDLARHIAEIARLRYPSVAIEEPLRGVFAAMGIAAEKVAGQVSTLLETRDLELAAAIERDDDELDALHKQTFGVMLGPDWQGNPAATVDVTLCGRYFERFGDHGVSIAKRVAFLVTGDFSEDAGAVT